MTTTQAEDTIPACFHDSLGKLLDLYALLHVPLDATRKKIQSSYRKQALKCHPDKNPDDVLAQKKFLLLQQAYEWLSNPLRRKQYDEQLERQHAALRRHQQKNAEKRQFQNLLEERERASKAPRCRVHEPENNQYSSTVEQIQRDNAKFMQQWQKETIFSSNANKSSMQKTDEDQYTQDKQEMQFIVKVKLRSSTLSSTVVPPEFDAKKIFADAFKPFGLRKITIDTASPLRATAYLDSKENAIRSVLHFQKHEMYPNLKFVCKLSNCTDNTSASFSVRPTTSFTLNSSMQHQQKPKSISATSSHFPKFQMKSQPNKSMENLEADVMERLKKMAEKQREKKG